ncbi:PIF-7 [Chrysodeixis includens nucleopolyhedrovirus]|uniref:PIF-7 n=1 Tax=Chrysodeixis includens nucleopolyhedrovirus TaxID=1207438 RepID=A0A5B8YUY0_9ABAC|nr:PIF-7 [Chrysodeixis includens nucleopolyhedrovirus]QED40614.1 PIF-7 [Chrysodeixis includens nucleopolyhedrovirus]
MYLCIVLLVVIFVICVSVLILLRINKSQLRQQLYYQYKYIPEPLISLVTVENLKQ